MCGGGPMLSCGLRRPRMRRSLRRARISNRPRQCGGFEVTRMRSRVFNGLALVVSLSRFGGLTVRPWAASFFSRLSVFDDRSSLAEEDFFRLFGHGWLRIDFLRTLVSADGGGAR